MSEFPTPSPQTLIGPTETYFWRYSAKDLSDELVFGIVFVAISLILCAMHGESWISLFGVLGILAGIGTCAYWIWIANLFFVRRVCTSYELNPQNFVYKHGFFIQRTRFIELFDIEQVNIKRNLWERLIGVGTVQLRIKDQGDKGNGGIESLDIPGMTDFEDMQKLINEYRMYYRTKVGTPLVKA